MLSYRLLISPHHDMSALRSSRELLGADPVGVVGASALLPGLSAGSLHSGQPRPLAAPTGRTLSRQPTDVGKNKSGEFERKHLCLWDG